MNMQITKISHTTSETQTDDKDTHTINANNTNTKISITQNQPFEGYVVGDHIKITIDKTQKTIQETTQAKK